MGYSMARCSYGIGRGGAALGAAGDGLDVCVGASLTLLAAMGAVARRAGCDWAAGVESLCVCTLNGQEERADCRPPWLLPLSLYTTVHAGPGDHGDDLQPCHDQHIARSPITSPEPKCLSCKGTPSAPPPTRSRPGHPRCHSSSLQRQRTPTIATLSPVDESLFSPSM